MPNDERNGFTRLEGAVNKSQHHCEACQEKFRIFGQHYNDLEPRIYNLEERFDGDISGTRFLERTEQLETELRARIDGLEGRIFLDSDGVQALKRIEQLGATIETRIDSLESKIVSVSDGAQALERIEGLEARINGLKEQLGAGYEGAHLHVTQRIEQLEPRISDLEKHSRARVGNGEVLHRLEQLESTAAQRAQDTLLTSVTNEDSVVEALQLSASELVTLLAACLKDGETLSDEESALLKSLLGPSVSHPEQRLATPTSQSSAQNARGPETEELGAGNSVGLRKRRSEPLRMPTVQSAADNAAVKPPPRVHWKDFRKSLAELPREGTRLSRAATYKRVLCNEAGRALLDQQSKVITGVIGRSRKTSPPEVHWAPISVRRPRSGFVLCEQGGKRTLNTSGQMITRRLEGENASRTRLIVEDYQSEDEDDEESEPDAETEATNEEDGSEVDGEHEHLDDKDSEDEPDVEEAREQRPKKRRGSNGREASRSIHTPKRRRISSEPKAANQHLRRSSRDPKPTERANLHRQIEKRATRKSQADMSITPNQRVRFSALAAQQLNEDAEPVATLRSTRSQARPSSESAGAAETITPRRSSRPIKPTEKDKMMITWKQVKEDSRERNLAARRKSAQRR